MSIKIFYDEVKFRLQGSGKIKKFLEKVIMAESKRPGDLNFIFTNDQNLRNINLRFLEHDYFTDVIAFDYSDENIINGEIYLSIETVRRNAEEYRVCIGEEVIRVMVHGTLHLCGYRDGTRKEKELMTGKQEFYIMEYRSGR